MYAQVVIGRLKEIRTAMHPGARLGAREKVGAGDRSIAVSRDQILQAIGAPSFPEQLAPARDSSGHPRVKRDLKKISPLGS
jgi:hypothetical protein